MGRDLGQSVPGPGTTLAKNEGSSEKSRGRSSWFAGPPVAVGMNIDIASIDMVSEVNMVSTEVYDCVSSDIHWGQGGERSQGVCGYVYAVGARTGFCFATPCVCSVRASSFWSLQIFPTWFNYLGLGIKQVKCITHSHAKCSHRQETPCRSHLS